MSLILPELRLIAHVETYLAKLRAELEANPQEPEKTWLYKVFGEQKLDEYRYFDEAAALLLDQTTGQPALRLVLGFPDRPEGAPVLALLLPGESTGKTDTIGMSAQPYGSFGMGDYQQFGVDYTDPNQDYTDYNLGQATLAGTDGSVARSFSATYNLMIVAQTSQQAVLLYHLLRALLIATLTELGTDLLTPSLGGQDVRLDEQNGGYQGLFMRTLSISLSYEARVPSLLDGPETGPIGHFEPTKS
jgi:hypothetical protein